MHARAENLHPSKKPAAAKKMPRAARPAVLHICADLQPGEPARETVDLSILAQKAGWRVIIASGGGLLAPEAERNAAWHSTMPIGKPNLLARWQSRLALAALVQKERPALLHAHGLEAVAAALPVAKNHRLPLIADLTQPPANQIFARQVLGQLASVAAMVRVPSDFMAARLRDQFQWPAERLTMIPPGIDLNAFEASAVSAERLQNLSRLWRLPENAAVILVPPPISTGSGYKSLLPILAQIRDRDIFAVLAGDNRHSKKTRAEIETLIAQHHLQGRVIVPDYCPDWPAACWLATIMVTTHATPRGQFPELLMAQAMGRPVIAIDSGANGEMAQSGETAWLVPPNSSKIFKQSLSEAIALSMNQRVDLAARTRTFVADHFPQSLWRESMMELYDSMAFPTRAVRAA